MADKKAIGCARPTGGPVGQPETVSAAPPQQPQQGATPMIKIGKKAPDFSAPAYHNGDFTAVTLSDYLGKWVALCFYPGDFTFV